MVAQSTKLVYETIKSFDSAGMTSSYQAVGSPSTHPARIFKLVNNTSMAITVSVDGINDHDFLPAGTFVLYDVGANRGSPAPELCLQPTQMYVKGTAGTGFVYFVVLYADTPNPRIPL